MDTQKLVEKIANILCKHPALSHARRSKLTILVDENVEVLKDSLIAMGYRVLSLKKGLQDPEIQQLAQGSAILTKNSKDFICDAVRFDYDVIGVEDIKYIDTAKDEKNHTAKKVSNAIRKSQFYNIRGNFFIKILDNGKYTIITLK